MHVTFLLDNFEQTLLNHVAHVLTIASESPPGGAAKWESVLASLGLEGVPSGERGRIAAQRSHVRGAFPEEVEHVLAVLAIQARQTLQFIAGHHQQEIWADPLLGERFAKLDAKLITLAETERAGYEKSLKPAPSKGAGVGGIFANVRASKEISLWNNVKWDQQFSLTCPGCGGAQQVVLVFTCKYCGANLFGEGAEDAEP